MTEAVLVLGAEPRVTVTIARSLDRRGILVHVAALAERERTLPSRAIRSFTRLPAEPGAFLDALSRLLREETIDYLIPATDTALAAVSQHDAALRELVRVACPPPQIVKRVLDKDLTLELAARAGIPVPKSHEVADLAALEALRGTLRFPLVAKPRSKRSPSSFKVRYVRDFDELARAFREDARFGVDNVIQDYCRGVGVGVSLLVAGGEVVAAFQHRRVKELPASGGVSVVAISEALDPDLTRCARELLRALEWEGVAQVEYRVDRDAGSFALMEVNGRYWGSLSSAVNAGCDFPYYQWQLAHGQRVDAPLTYKIGMGWRWAAGDLVRIHAILAPGLRENLVQPSRPTELWTFVRDSLRPTRGALWSWTDPLPALAEVAHTLRALAVADTKVLLRLLLPEPWRHHWRARDQLTPHEARMYTRLLLRRVLRLRRDRERKPAPDVRSVLFVCHGNILRSPMAAVLFARDLAAHLRDRISVRSAGLHAVPGRQADARGREVAAELGISLEAHRTRLLTAELVESSDAIFVMDYLNEAKLLARFPHAELKVFLLGAFGDPRDASLVIPDPYTGSLSDVRQCYETLSHRVHALQEQFGWAPRSAPLSPRPS